MRLVFFDCESFYDRKGGYSLSAKGTTTESYVRDPRFELHGAAIKWAPSERSIWYDERQLRFILKEEDWSDVFLVSHHAHWDHFVLSHHYDVHPKMSGCTMSMARLMLGNHIGVSLDSVRKEFGLPPKITPYSLFEGKHWSEMPQSTRDLVAEGACDEVDSKLVIFQRLMQDGFPPEELEIIDTTVKMFTEPCMRGDIGVLSAVWTQEETKKRALFARLNLNESDLASSDKFAALLRERGVEPEMKEGKNGPIYAFAKDDTFMEELLVDEDEEVSALAAARLGAKSTILGTRAETIGFMAQRGLITCYLWYCGAHTSRWSGGDKSNFQNWTNGSDINKALIAPEGYLIAEPDASQIECRLLNFCAGQDDKVDDFRLGRDPYVGVASEFFGEEVYKPKPGDPRFEEMNDKRQLGKVVELQAGYGSGGPKIAHTVRVKSGGKIILDEQGGMRARDAYRNTHPNVVQYWRDAELNIKRMINWLSFDWGPFRIRCDVETGRRRIVLPNGIQLIYDTLESFHDEDSGENYFRLKTRKEWVKMYGAKLVENIIQALARVVVSQAMIRLKYLGYRCIMTKHDSLWLLIPKDGRLEEHKAVILQEMSRSPAWMPEVPLAAEFKHIGERYA